MSEMVERVARAISPNWEYMSRNDRRNAVITARVAIEAMREPTEAMIKGAGWLYPMYDDPHDRHEDVWSAMIDEALK